MSLAATATEAADILLADLFGKAGAAVQAADTLLGQAKAAVLAKVAVNGKVSGAKLEAEQFAAHGLAWLATYVESLRQLLHWAESLKAEGKLGRLETLILQAGFGEYLSQIVGGIPMSQGEVVRPADYGLTATQVAAYLAVPEVADLIASGNTAEVRAELAGLIADGLASGFGDLGLDETMAMVRDSFRRFAEDKVIPFAHEWHLKDEFIPLTILSELAELGVFGLTLPEEYGGHGLGKTAMCVVTEELSRGYIGVGSLGTRAEIFCELVMAGGTEEQKRKWLPLIAGGELLPTAVFTEPNTGSDLGSLRTRAVRDGDVYKVTGNKTWITHAARADVMTLLARTNSAEPGYKGLSMFLAEKIRGDDANPFPTPGMTGGEIKVLGYRGMKEYEIGFDGFEVKAENLLGQQEGQGFKQLMTTFESARIQTAARAVGVAQSALELGLRYAQERIQFGKPIYAFPRVFGKLAWAAVEVMIARQITFFAAREKDAERRCDLEAGMAKLLGARVAWATADNAMQIHGGNGYAEEYPISRVLCDARILNVFEGAAEIQANVIARRLLEG
ncbi:acyl-CoA dehydrogenase family protein [Zavarzinia compransoris]|uniref:Acyl-CoA dehydrogenase n=1 Tax=Zavarzinia compransoris TaxID=1264899 RepID=A0A317E775_9PROT|nr:acyl-CoA dehydrogenase family protein [Zavarzinia compransoris]PWR22134.1 acyl-CoA dehydrogenase [Zavarzinia compransoris]TDP47116.1 (2S)-methylsuccinyl-CoA dehydrogenase [Zavarzinia compransoris]